jgi:hypothetical protein
MNKLRNYALAALAAGVLGTAGLQTAAYAAGDPGQPGAGMPMAGPAMNSAEFQKRAEARQAKLHDDLKLAPDQEAAWKTFTEKTKFQPPPARPDWAEISKLPAPDRMEKMLAVMREGVNRMSERLAAVKVFYAKLTPEQQKTFDAEYMAHHRGHHPMGPPPQR